MKSFVAQLIKAGLTPIQARTYVSVLQLGHAGATEIAKRADVNRVTCYTALEELENMDLIKSDNSEAVKTFYAKPPQNLERHFMTRAQASIQSYRHIQTLIPDLANIANREITHPETVFLEGETAIKHYLETLPEDLFLRSVYVSQHAHYDLFKDILKRAADADFRPQAIVPNSVKASLLVYLDHRVVPAKIAQFPCTSLVFDDRVIIIMDDNNLLQVLAIQDRRISAHYQMSFDLLWRILSGEHLVAVSNE